MPELPEVETLVQQLKKRVLGKKITQIEIIDPKVVDPKIKKISPFKITKIYRRAKSIIIETNNNYFLHVHLRMTGHFHFAPKTKLSSLDPYKKFIVAKFHISDDSLLTHNSIRKFGHINLLNKQQLQKELSKLGPEPLDKKFTLKKFKEIITKKYRANVKTTLMDQNFIAGVGNIYAQEALYHAHIDPRRKISSLEEKEISLLYQQIRKVLHKAIQHHETTVENYVHIEGTGGFQKYLAVYQKNSCPKKHPTKKTTLGGRGTFYCPQCQK